MAGNWNDFIASPLKASRQMHVSGRDIKRGAQIDARRRAELESQKQSPMYPSRENAERLPTSKADAMFFNALLRGPEQSATAAPTRAEQVARAALSGAGSFGGWAEEPVNEPTPDMLARFAGHAVSDPLNAVGLGALKYAGQVAKKALPTATALGTSAYASDAEAGPLSGLMKFLRSGVEPMHVVKPKSGNWLAGSVEDALQGLKRMAPPEDMARLREAGVPMEAVPRAQALDDWITGPLTKYVKHRMASPEDEVRRLADEGVLHFTPDWVPEPGMSRGLAAGMTGGNYGKELGKSRLAKEWEALTDQHLNQNQVQDFLYDQRTPYQKGNEWMTKVDPKSPVYGLPNEVPTNLGFDHLIDELSNALDPASGLPRHLQLTPEAVKQMSMEKAVRRVDEINKWRAAQKVEANRKLAEQASLVREYAENNPKGLRWVELRQNLPEKPTGDITDEKLLPWEEAKRRTAKELEDQLKYEGDTMGHCVGGYCDDVASGRSRIFSLRDAKGEPHVTVEVAPGQVIEVPEGVEPFGDRIVQIKGKQNKKPNDEYLPFVQDFVKNPPHGSAWGDVGDLQNTGLRRIGDAFNPHELGVLRSKGVELHPDSYLTPAELDAHQKLFNNAMTGTDYNPTRAWENFASGGTVQKENAPPQTIQGIIAAMKEYHAHA